MSQRAKSASPSSKFWRIYAAGVAACAAVSGGSYFFGIEPALARRDAYLAETAELQARHQKEQDLSKSLGAARRQLEQTTRDVADLPLQLEPAWAVNRRLARLTDVAGESGLVLEEVQPGAPVSSAHFQTVPIRIAGTGTYPACAAFLHRLRERFPDMGVKSFECASSATPAPLAAAQGRPGGATGPAAAFRAELAWYTTPAKK